MESGPSIAQIYPGLPCDQQFETDVRALHSQVKSRELPNTSVSKLESVTKLNACVLLAFLSSESPAIQSTSLQTFLSFMVSPADPIASLKRLLEASNEVTQELKLDLPAFSQLHTNFSFHAMFFSSLLKFTRIDFLRSLDTRSVQMIWLTFLNISKFLEHNRLDKRFNVLCALIFKSIYKEEDTPENLEEMNADFQSNMGFKLTYDEYAAKRDLIQARAPTFGSPGYDLKAAQQAYVDSLSRMDINMKLFFNSMDTDTSLCITLTPVNRRTLSLHSAQANPTHYDQVPKDVQSNAFSFGRECEFEEVTEMYRSPKRGQDGHRSPRRSGSRADPDRGSSVTMTENKDHVRELCNALQWYKDQVFSVKVKQYTPPSGEPVACSAFFRTFLDDPVILANLQQSTQTIRNKSQDADTLAFFFSILDKLIAGESSGSSEAAVRVLIKTNNFLMSVVCFALDLSASINRTSMLKFEEVLQLCQCGYIDVWKIIHTFTRSVGCLPQAVKLRVYELEADILLREIWTQSETKKCLAFVIFSTTNAYSSLAIQRIIQLLAQRIFFLTTELGLSRQIKETIWAMVKKLLFYGMDDENENIDISFKTNIHFDLVLLSAIYHVGYANNQYLNWGKLVDAYNSKATFGLPLGVPELKSVYNGSLKKKFQGLSQDTGFNCRIAPHERESRNGTPIQSGVWKRKKEMVQTPLEKSLPATLGKRVDYSPEIPVLPTFATLADPALAPQRGSLRSQESPIPRRGNEEFYIYNLPFGSPSPSTNSKTSPFFFGGSLMGSENRHNNENDPCLMEDTGIQTPTFK